MQPPTPPAAQPPAPMPAAPAPALLQHLRHQRLLQQPCSTSSTNMAIPAAPAAPARQTHQSSPEVRERLQAVGAIATAISAEVQKVIIGKPHVIDNVLINILSNGNLLFEDYPDWLRP